METIHHIWESKRDDISSIIAKLWENPELPMKEYKSSAILADWLEREGFSVKKNFCDMPTAFLATFGEGTYNIGILAEYDAMAGLDNDACARRKELGNEAGHACMHSHIGGANVGAAIAVKNYLEKSGKKAKITVIGTPAEEIIYGKIAIQERGGFEGIDILLTSHVDYQNGALSRMCSPCVYGELQFNGFSDHAGSPCSKNALDAAELTVQTIEKMNAHYFKNTRINHIYRNAGKMSSIVPDQTLLWLTIRNMDYAQAKNDYKQIVEIAKAFANFTGTTLKEGYISSSNGYLANDVIGKALDKNIQRLGAPAYTESELSTMETFCETVSKKPTMTLDKTIGYFDQGYDIYGQDDGEISWQIPLGRINWAAPEEVPLHNWIMSAFAGLKESHVGALWASKVLFLTAVDLIDDTSIIEQAKNELQQRTQGITLEKAHVENFEIFTKQPELFWEAKWHDYI
ncbi:amidohydrolase [Bengtsoniella intestinalis]|uniref:amidohydrolase n=1 Tax=Bengtsoniella intestinalis TaxID=3073143 RepID=UPI00391EE5AE